jgi:hypothetical protein
VDAGANVYVTGFGTNFNTVKLSPAGSNVWFAQYVDVGPTSSQSILLDTQTNIYVSGSDTYEYYGEGPSESYPNSCLTVAKFDLNGNLLWTAQYKLDGDEEFGNVAGAALDNANNIYLAANFLNRPGFITIKYSSAGTSAWAFNPDNGTAPANGLVLDSNGNVLLVGQDAYAFNGAYSYYYSIFKLNTAGTETWGQHYPQPPFGSSAATSIAVDSANNSYITGYSPDTNSYNDIVTIKYDQNGNQIWVQRYQSLGAGNAAGCAIAVDNNGNVYVTGYDTTTAGGTEIVTIKYSAVTIQHQSNGTILLQAQGSPGESFDVQASTDLQTWLDLGTAIADTNGLAQFDDTNAPNFDWRFYITQPQ